jgi:predicted enzyme related to lactoylglutathione lyase
MLFGTSNNGWVKRLNMLSKAEFATITPVKNMDRAIKFYTKTLGGKLEMRAPGDMKDMWASIRIGKQAFWLGPRDPKLKKLDFAFSTFVVKDIKAEVSDLRKRGAKFQRAEKNSTITKIDGPISYSEFGAGAFFNDSEGNLLMLWQNMGQ